MIDITYYGNFVKNVLEQIFGFLSSITIKFGENEVSVLNIHLFLDKNNVYK